MTVPAAEAAEAVAAKKAAKKVTKSAERAGKAGLKSAGNPPKGKPSAVKRHGDPGSPKHAKPKAATPGVGRHRENQPGRVGRTVASQRQKRSEAKSFQKSAEKAAQRGAIREQARIKASKSFLVKPRIRMVAAEYLVAIIAVVFALFYVQLPYKQRITKFFVQVTAISMLFFILAMLSASERASRTVIYAGLFIDLAIIFQIAKDGVLGALSGSPSQGTPAGGGHNTQASDIIVSSWKGQKFTRQQVQSSLEQSIPEQSYVPLVGSEANRDMSHGTSVTA